MNLHIFRRLVGEARKADPWLIHKLEYELGLRDDAPPRRYTDAPGAIIDYYPAPQTMIHADSILKEAYGVTDPA